MSKNPFLDNNEDDRKANSSNPFDSNSPFGSPFPAPYPSNASQNRTTLPIITPVAYNSHALQTVEIPLHATTPTSSDANYYSSYSPGSAWSFQYASAPPPPSSSKSLEIGEPPKKYTTSSTSRFGKLFQKSSKNGSNSSPSYTNPFITTNDSALNDANDTIQRREAEVQRREVDLARREAALASMNGSTIGTTTNNWPFSWCALLHHDINADIPYTYKGLVKAGYFAWWLVFCAYIWNFICMTTFFIANQKKVSLWVFSGLVAITGIPLSFLCWYRPLYRAVQKDTGWVLYFFNFLVHIIWCWWMFVGINPNLGGYSAGLFTMIEQFSDGGGRGIAFGILCVINMCLFASSGMISMGVMGKSWYVFRQAGCPPSSSAANPKSFTRRGTTTGPTNALPTDRVRRLMSTNDV